MADLKIDGRMKVKTLKENFKKNFGATLRVYKSITCKGAFADDDATLASLRSADAKRQGSLNTPLLTKKRRMPKIQQNDYSAKRESTSSSLQ